MSLNWDPQRTADYIKLTGHAQIDNCADTSKKESQSFLYTIFSSLLNTTLSTIMLPYNLVELVSEFYSGKAAECAKPYVDDCVDKSSGVAKRALNATVDCGKNSADSSYRYIRGIY